MPRVDESRLTSNLLLCGDVWALSQRFHWGDPSPPGLSDKCGTDADLFVGCLVLVGSDATPGSGPSSNTTPPGSFLQSFQL